MWPGKGSPRETQAGEGSEVCAGLVLMRMSPPSGPLSPNRRRGLGRGGENYAASLPPLGENMDRNSSP